MSLVFQVAAAGVLDLVPQGIYTSEKCGICKRQGNDDKAFWYNPTSRWAHSTCLAQIKPLENELFAKINELFPGHLETRQRNMAHLCAIRVVENLCEPDSLLQYYQKQGAAALTNLFNSEGINAALRFAAANMQSKA
jgi:hypothetical protein